MRANILRFFIALLTGSLASALAQNAPVNPSEHRPVSVSMFVTDAHGNPVSAISDGDVNVEDEHKPPRSVITVTHDVSPLRLGVLIDKSNSQRRSDLYKAGVQGLSTFLKEVLRRDTDKAFIETFDSSPDRPTEWMSADELGKASLNLQPSGATSLFDAIELACKERLSDNFSPARRVLVVLSDGGDTSSRSNLDAATAAAQRAKTAIITISTHEEGNIYQRGGTDGVLKRLAENTGGYAFLDLRPKDIQKVFSNISQQLDAMFQVVYVPAEPVNSGEAHQVEIKATSGKKLHVHAPKRYFGTTQ